MLGKPPHGSIALREMDRPSGSGQVAMIHPMSSSGSPIVASSSQRIAASFGTSLRNMTLAR